MRYRHCLPLLLILFGMALGCRQSGSGQSDAVNAPAPGPQTATIAGQITMDDKSDPGGIQVYIPGTRWFALTDSQGHFAIEDVGIGAWKVMTRAPGFESLVLSEAVAVGEADLGQEILLEPARLKSLAKPAPATAPATDFGSIEGRVTVPGVDPAELFSITGEIVVELEGTPYRTTCQSEGIFLLWNLPAGDYRVAARARGMQPAVQPVRLLPGEKAGPLELVLLTTQTTSLDGVIRGQVELYDSQGTPTNEFSRIAVRLLESGRTVGLQPDGTFVFENVERGFHIVTASGSGFTQAAPVEVDLTSQREQTIALMMIATEPTPSETGRIIGFVMKGGDGITDMSGVSVALAGSSFSAVSDNLGQFTISNITPGNYQVVATAQGYRQADVGPIEVKAGEELNLEGIYLEPDREAPRVLSTNPGDGAKDVMIRREIPVEIRFSQKMAPESLRQAVKIEPEVAYTLYTGREHPQTDYDLARLVLHGTEQEPVAMFRTRYTVTIGTDAANFEGDKMEAPFSFSFTTGDPAVVATVPEDGGRQQGFGPRQLVAIYFNARMDHRTLTPEAINIRPRLAMTPNLSISDDPVTGWTRMHLSANWQPGTEYEITIERRARTTGRDSLMNTPFSFRFSTPRQVSPRVPTLPTGR